MGAPSRFIEVRGMASSVVFDAGTLRSPGGGFDGGGESEHHECVVDLVGGGGLRPRLLPDALYRARVEPADVRRGLRIEGTPHGHRPRPALFERCVVEERIGPGVEHLRGERRGLGEVARDDPDLPRVESGHEGFERVDVHRIVQCVGRSSAPPADARGSHAARRGSRRRRSGRETPRPRDPRPACAGCSPGPWRRCESAAPRARRSHSSASAR